MLDNVKYMIEVREIAITAPLYQQERNLRNRILLRPIGIPDFGWEMHDAESLHFVALSEDRVVGCVILYLAEGDGSARLMQMAVDADCQRQGVGRKLIECLLRAASKRKISRIVCHAREDAADFYSKIGFQTEGEPFLEAGARHFYMTYELQHSHI